MIQQPYIDGVYQTSSVFTHTNYTSASSAIDNDIYLWAHSLGSLGLTDQTYYGNMCKLSIADSAIDDT